MRRFLASLPLLLLAAALAPAARAQSLAMAPAQIIDTFKPGVPLQRDLTVENDGNDAVELHVQITDFWFNDKNEKTFNPPGTSPRSAANWIQFVPEKFVVPAHGSQKMRAIITPPVGASGGYYAVLFVESRPVPSNEKTKEGKAVFTNLRLGCLVLLTAEGTAQYKVKLDGLKLTPPSGDHPLALSFDLENGGNTHIFPVARLAILDAQHKLVAKAETEPRRFLPGQKQAMQIGWSGVLPPGQYDAVLSLVYAENRVETRQAPFTVGATKP